MKRHVTKRVKELLQHAKAVDELLEAVAEEMEKSSALEKQLETEKGKCNSLETELMKTKRSLLDREHEIKSLKRQVDFLNERFKAVLEICLFNYLKERKGELSIKDYASEFKISEAWVKEALESLQKKGKIKLAP